MKNSFENKQTEERKKELRKEVEKKIDQELSGNPAEKYKGGIREFHEKAMESGEYKPYIKQVEKETEDRFDELSEEVEREESAPFTKTLEDIDREEFYRQKEEEDKEEE